MKGVKSLASRMLAVILAGALTVVNLSVSALGAEDVVDYGTTSEIAAEEIVDETVAEEQIETDSAGDAYRTENTASSAETTLETAVEDTVSTPADAAEVPIASYTITLDANGGYFENEWDDVLGEYVEKAEILNRVIPVSGTVSTYPVNLQENSVATFLGWSMERDGELVWQNQNETVEKFEQRQEEVLEQEQEGYAPVDDCTLYAVWKVEELDDLSPEENHTKDFEDDTSSDEHSVPETEEDEDAYFDTMTSDQQDNSTDREEAASNNTGQDENEESNENIEVREEINVIEDAAMEEVAREESKSLAIAIEDEITDGWTRLGTCEWQVDDAGVLTIRPAGNGSCGIMSSTSSDTWGDKRSLIKKACIMPGVKAGASTLWMFSCPNLETVEGLENLDTSDTTDMSCMFNSSKVKTVDLSNLDTSKVTGMRSMFAGCSNLESVNLEGLNTSSLGTAYNMFSDTGNFVISWDGFDLSNVDANDMFYGSKIENIDFSRVKTNASTNLYGAFCDCHQLKTANMSGVNSSSYGCLLAYCENLTDVDFTGANFDRQSQDYMMYRCNSLTKVPKGFRFTGAGENPFFATGETLFFYYEGCDSNIINHDWNSENRILKVTIQHSWSNDYTVDKEATCKEEGAESIHCSVCNTIDETTIHTIPTTGHKWNEDYIIDIQPTYTTEGSKSIHCYVCDAVKEGSEIAIPKLRKPVSKLSFSGIVAKTYTGKALMQTFVVNDEDKTLVSGTDYTVSYFNNINAGTATVTITGKGNYTGTKSATFKINKANQSITAKSTASSIAVGKTATVSITGNKGTKSYKSSNTAIATVTSAGKVTAKKVGTVTITATSAATANYNAASKTVTIKVVPTATASITAANQATGIKLTWKKVTGATGYKVYRGSTLIKTIKSGATVTCTDTKANTNGTQYTFKIVPTASTGNGTAKSLTTYRVARPSVSSVKKSASKKMTVKWAKNAKATGYQIQYSKSKTFASGNKTATVTKAATVSKVIGSLTKGKTYYVRIRTYKTVGNTKYWSAWSAAKSVKISK